MLYASITTSRPDFTHGRESEHCPLSVLKVKMLILIFDIETENVDPNIDVEIENVDPNIDVETENVDIDVD